MPPGGLLRIWPVASLLGQSSIAADTLLPSRLATGQIRSNERTRIYEIDHLDKFIAGRIGESGARAVEENGRGAGEVGAGERHLCTGHSR